MSTTKRAIETETAEAPKKDKAERGDSRHGIDLGITASQGNRGIFIDPYVVMTIQDPRHPMHEEYEPERYATTDPVFAALIEQVFNEGSLDSPPLLFPLVPAIARDQAPNKGYWPADDPVIAYIKKTYEAKIVKLYGSVDKLPPQPIICTAYGNSRTLANIFASAKRGPGQVIRLLVTARIMKLEEARRLFSLENNIRRANSAFQNYLIVKGHIERDGWTWDMLVSVLGLPEATIKATYEYLLKVESMEVVRAALSGRISKADVKRLMKLRTPEGRLLSAAEMTEAMNAPKPERESKPPSRTLGAVEKRSIHTIICAVLADPKRYEALLDGVDLTVLQASMPKLADAPAETAEAEACERQLDISDCASSVEVDKKSAPKKSTKAKR